MHLTHTHTGVINTDILIRTLINCKYGDQSLPLPELRVKQTIRETFPADTNTFQHTITPQLVEDKMSIKNTSLLHLVGNNATNEMRDSVTQCGHQVIE